MINFDSLSPGVYVTTTENPQPLPSAGVRHCYMLGTASSGPENTPQLITNLAAFNTTFSSSPSAPYVEQFLNLAQGLYFINVTSVSDPTAAEIATALSGLEEGMEPALLIAPEIFALPGRTDSVDVAAEMSKAAEAFGLFVLLDTPADLAGTVGVDDLTGVRGYSEDVRDNVDVNPDYLALFFPYIDVDGTDYAPSAMIAAAAIRRWFASVDVFVGGLNNPLPGEPSIILTKADRDALALLSINPLVPREAGTVIYGVRSLRVSTPWLINSQVTRNLLSRQLQEALEPLLFTAVRSSGTVYNRAKLLAVPVLNRFWQLGGLAGNSASEAYSIVCGPENNNEQDVLNGNLLVEVFIRPTGAVEKVLIPITITS